MIGVVWILLCWLIGQGVSHLVDGYVSGNIVGMVLLFLLLLLRQGGGKGRLVGACGRLQYIRERTAEKSALNSVQ